MKTGKFSLICTLSLLLAVPSLRASECCNNSYPWSNRDVAEWDTSHISSKTCCESCDFSEFALNSDAAYNQGHLGGHESASTCLGASMLAWGLGLTVVIALVAGLAHQSKADTPPTTD